jgi:NTE family protein
MISKLVFSHQILLFLQTIRRYFDHGNLMNTKDVALALSSGGARGLAHIGAIEELESNGYHITSIAGCSMGALIGGVYAAGKLEEFREWMKTIDRKKMLELTDFSFSINHLVKGNRIIEAIMDFVPDIAIEELPIPYCAVATDLKAGREVVIDKGSLFEAIRASISLPSFYEPVQRDDMILIDGGVINPIPLNRVKRNAGDILVGVDVSGHDYKSQWDEMHRLTEWQKNDKSLKAKILDKLIPDNIEFNYYTVLSRTSSLMIRQNSILMAKLMKPEMLIDIQMNRYGTFDFDKSEKLIAIGRQKTAQAILAMNQKRTVEYAK